MEYRKLGKTTLRVSAIGYGTLKLPRISQEEAARCLHRALELGINFVDSARDYGDSESKVGRALKGRRGEFLLATKTSARRFDSAMADLQTSLRELQTDYLDLWQLHSVSDEPSWQQVMAPGGALQAARHAQAQGMVRHVGISVHRAIGVMHKAIECGEFETIMLCYNPIDAENVAAVLPLARRRGLGVITMKALSGGTMAYPKQVRRAGFGGPDALVAGALRWVLGNQNVHCVLAGMQAVHEVEENVPLADPPVPLSNAEHREFLKMLGEFAGEYRYGQRCLACGYCQPCPEGVNIPAILLAARLVSSYPDGVRHQGYEIYEQLQVGAEACVECEKCVEKCPAALPIPSLLKEARQVLERK